MRRNRMGLDESRRDERGSQRTRPEWLPTPTFSQGSRLHCLGCIAMDIFILAGQSNMAGRGNTKELPAPYIAADRQGEYERTSRTLDICCKLEHITYIHIIEHPASSTRNRTRVHCEQQMHWRTLVYDTRERLQWSLMRFCVSWNRSHSRI